MASPKFETARKQNESFVVGGVKIVFPAFDDLPEKTLRLGTTDFESADGEEYDSALREVPSSRFREGSAQDFADWVLNDPDSVWYEQIKPYEDVFEDSRITVTEFLLTEDDVWEGEIILEGFLEKLTLSESDYSLSFSGISDMSRTGFPVGGRILTQRYCGAKFNANGALAPEIDPCGWQMSQGGNPVFCTHKRTGAHGCEDHNNAHRFFAVEGLTSAQIQYVAGGGIGGGGWEYGGGYDCFTRETLIWMADGSYKPIWKIKIGDSVRSFTPAGDLVERRVAETFHHRAENFVTVDFGKNRTVKVKPGHFFLIGADSFQRIGEMEAGETVRCRKTDDWHDLPIRRIVEKKRLRRFYNFRVEETPTYFIVLPDETKIGVHNVKNNTLENIQQ